MWYNVLESQHSCSIHKGGAVDEVFAELVGVDAHKVLKFFFERLYYVVPRDVMPEERLYAASVLAHFAQTSRSSNGDMAPGDLSDVFDAFILSRLTEEGAVWVKDSEVLEVAASQTLLFTGFFWDQMEQRHNLDWFTHQGQWLFRQASEYSHDGKRAGMCLRVADNFNLWRRSYRDLSRAFREDRYVVGRDSQGQ